MIYVLTAEVDSAKGDLTHLICTLCSTKGVMKALNSHSLGERQSLGPDPHLPISKTLL